MFETSLEREAGQALDENSILSFAFETAVLNVPAKYDVLQDSTVEQIAYCESRKFCAHYKSVACIYLANLSLYS